MPAKALIIIDMLNDFIDEKGALYCGEAAQAIVPVIKRRLHNFRVNKDLVIYLQDSHDKNDKEFEKFPVHCLSDSWGGQIIEELVAEPNEKIISKKRFSGFYGTELEHVLANAGVEEVQVVGVCTSICVMDTVGGLVNRDYKVSVPASEVADFNPEAHEYALKRMKQIYGAIVS